MTKKELNALYWIVSQPVPECHELSHSKKQHHHGTPCPAREVWREYRKIALDAIKKELNKQNETNQNQR